MIMKLWPIWIMFFYVFFCNIKVNHFLHCFIVLLHLISPFLHTRSFLVPYAYVSIESIDCTLLLSFKVKAILLIFSIKTLCLSLLNLCFVFNVNLLFFRNSCQFHFFLDSLFYFQVAPLLNSFYNLQI